MTPLTRLALLLLGCAALLLPVTALAQSSQPTAPPTGPTLATVLARGQVVCAVNEEVFGFGFLNPNTGDITGLYVDLCRAVATAVFGDPAALDLRLRAYGTPPADLLDGTLDLLFDHGLSRTLSTDARTGLEFGAPVFYDGLAFMHRSGIELATLDDLDGRSVCVVGGSADMDSVRATLSSRSAAYELVTLESLPAMYAAFEAGRCDAQAAPRSLLQIRRWSSADPNAYSVWETPFTLTARAPVFRYGDKQWADIVNWTMWGLVQAEIVGITSANINTFLRTTAETDEAYIARVGLPAARLLDPALGAGGGLGLPNDFMARVISRVGSYAEIYERSLGPAADVPIARGANLLVRDGGLLDSPSWR